MIEAIYFGSGALLASFYWVYHFAKARLDHMAEVVSHSQTKAALRAATAEYRQLSRGLYNLLHDRDYD